MDRDQASSPEQALVELPPPLPSPAGGGFADCPLADLADDRLGRRQLIEGLAGLLDQPSPNRALLVGVYGEPGSGRTSVLQMIRSHRLPGAPSVWLDAWYHARQGLPLWWKLLFALIEGLGDEELGLPAAADTEFRKAMVRRELAELSACLLRSQRSLLRDGAERSEKPGGVDLKRLGGKEGRDAEAQADARERARLQDDILALDAFHCRLDALLSGMADEPGQPRGVTLFIDHLDRCAPGEAKHALEVVRLLLDVPEMRIVVALDPRRGAEAAEPLPEGVVDLGVRLVPPERPRLEAFARDLARSFGLEPRLLAPLAALGAGPNPRRVREVLVGVALLQRIGFGSRLEPLTKLLALRTGFPKEFKALRDTPGRLKELERAARTGTPDAGASPNGTKGREAAKRLEQLLRAAPELAAFTDAALQQLIAAIDHIP